jgi:hypothetical protein
MSEVAQWRRMAPYDVSTLLQTQRVSIVEETCNDGVGLMQALAYIAGLPSINWASRGAAPSLVCLLACRSGVAWTWRDFQRNTRDSRFSTDAVHLWTESGRFSCLCVRDSKIELRVVIAQGWFFVKTFVRPSGTPDQRRMGLLSSVCTCASYIPHPAGPAFRPKVPPAGYTVDLKARPTVRGV